MSTRKPKENTEKKPTAKNSANKQQTKVQTAKYIVHLLPNFADDHRSDTRAVSEYCDEIAGGSDYLNEIRERFGSGFFRVSERSTEGKIIAQWVIHIADEVDLGELEEDGEPVELPTRERVIVKQSGRELLNPVVIQSIAESAAQRAVAAVQQNQQPAQSNSFEEMLKTVERVESFRAKIVGNQPGPSQPQPVATEKPLEERLLETVVVKALETNPDGSTLDKVLDVLGGGKAKEPSLMESIGEFLKPLVPVVGEMAMKYMMQQQMNQASPQPAQPVQPQAPAQPAHDPGKLPPASPAQSQLLPEQKSFLKLLARIRDDCEDNMPFDGVIASVESFEMRYPTHPGVTILQTVAPQDILGQIGLEATPERVQWILGLQAALKDVEEEEEQPLEAAASL